VSTIFRKAFVRWIQHLLFPVVFLISPIPATFQSKIIKKCGILTQHVVVVSVEGEGNKNEHHES